MTSAEVGTYKLPSRALKHKQHVYTIKVITVVSELPALLHTVDSILYSKCYHYIIYPVE